MIKTIDFNKYQNNYLEYIQSFLINDIDKIKKGVVYTPFSLIKEIFSIIPFQEFTKKHYLWLDIGSGFGNFTFILYYYLFNYFKDIILDFELCHNHIIKMIYLCEINPSHINYLKKFFGENINLFTDFFLINKSYYKSFDFIIGNPPYNYGTIKTPTNQSISKKTDGKTIWQEFIIKSIDLLKDNGYLCVIIPAIWLKPDKAGIYNILTKYQILKLKCFSNTQTNKLFNYKAQTPTCYFLLKKTLVDNTNNTILIYDQIYNKFISYHLQANYPIPMFSISIINKFLYFVKKYGYIKVHKTNLPSKNCSFSNNFSYTYSYINISSCVLSKNNKLMPQLITNYSNQPTQYFNQVKLILAHKMYGFPYLDISGSYGISTRDNYIIKDYSISQLKNISKFLSTKIILYLYLSTQYRMKYLEKYIFKFIPDISKIKEFDNLPNNIYERDLFINNFFNLTESEINTINLGVKDYKFFY